MRPFIAAGSITICTYYVIIHTKTFTVESEQLANDQSRNPQSSAICL